MEDQEKQQRTSTVSNTTEGYGSSKKSENKKNDLSAKYRKRHSPSQWVKKIVCSVCLEYLSLT